MELGAEVDSGLSIYRVIQSHSASACISSGGQREHTSPKEQSITAELLDLKGEWQV